MLGFEGDVGAQFYREVGMRVHVRVWVSALLAGVLTAAFASAAQAAEEPVFVAVNCKVEECAQSVTKINLGAPFGEQDYVEPAEPNAQEAEEEGYLQAGGRVPYGVTDFKVATKGSLPVAKPTAVVEHIRTDVAPGLATNPTAVTECSSADFVETEPLPGTGFYPAPTCATSGPEDTQVGKQHATVFLETNKATGEGIDLALEGTVYNLKPKEGLASEFGVALKLPIPVTAGALATEYFPYLESIGKAPSAGEQAFLEAQQYYAHTLIEGNVEWGKQAKGTDAGDYHDYFEINVSPALPLISSRLDFEGRNGTGDFVTNATSCPGNNTTTLKLTDKGAAAPVEEKYTTPVGLMGCNGETDKFGTKFERLAFEPTFTLSGASATSDEPDELTTAVTEPSDPTANSQSQVKTASVTLPEGMTLNPSAAAGLEACTKGQARIHGEEFGTACPAKSEIGTVSLDVPTLPNGSLTGAVYLGASESGTPSESGKVTGGPPYIMYVVANSGRYGVSVRLKAEVVPDEATGRVTTIFNENPEQPFTNLTIQFNRGALTAVANPLVCGESHGAAVFTPTTGHPASEEDPFAFSTTGCASSIPFVLTQSTSNQTTNAGAHTSFTFNLGRADGQQYLSKVSTTLPEGLVGEIPAVKQCSEAEVAAAEANKGGCSAETQIGTATVLAGSGATPYTFTGNVYLTGPYNGAPYGMAVVVPGNAGPFELGNVVTRATININPETTRVTIASTLPTIHKGIPLRVRNISIAVTKQGFMLNPTNCTTPLATESTLTSTMGATQSGLSTAFPVTNCSALAFKPTFAAKTSAKTSKANGASLETTLNLPLGDGNVKSAIVQLPLQLPSRLTTLQKACPEATFAANPYSCPAGSFVGGARANTPVLPSKLTGPAILVSHGGEAFPDLDLVMEADNVRVILVGHTKITKGITTTDFATTPDAPVTSITVNLPIGAHSALTNYGGLCPKPLVMPTTVTGQNGVVFKQNTIIKVAGCGVRIVGHKVVGNTAYITVQTFAAGRVSGSGKSLSTVYEHFNAAKKTATLKVPLSGAGKRRGRPFKVKLRVGFLPKQKGLSTSASFATLSFR